MTAPTSKPSKREMGPAAKRQMTPAAERQMTMVAFMQAQNCSNYIGSWRNPVSHSDFLRPEYFQRIARTLEDGKFHMAFFDDRLAMPDRYKNDHEAAIEAGARVVKMDLIPLLTAMGLATSKLGLGGTYSTTYYQPFHVARVFSTLDHMIGGRAAWNVVTSLNDCEALNFGLEQHMEHDLRYDQADEFLEVVLGHWDTWEDDALIVDKAHGPFRRRQKSAPARPQGEMVQVARALHGAGDTAGAACPDPGGTVGPWQELRCAVGRTDFLRLQEHRHGQGELQGAEGSAVGRRPRPGLRRHLSGGLCDHRRDPRDRRGEEGAIAEATGTRSTSWRCCRKA